MKYYNNIKSLFCGALLLIAAGSFTSCKDWLDKDPESIISEDEAFKNFRNFQGYIEEIYSLIPDKEKINYCTSWNFGEDAVHNPEGYSHMDHQVDLGNYRNWISNTQCWLNGNSNSLWTNSWYSIRKCNMGIQNIKSMVGTDEERDILLGQMYFFRAWWHFELMCYFGGLPYIEEVYEDSNIPQLKRLSFQECADKCAADFQKAYEKLPLDWDATVVSERNGLEGKNGLRVNKFTALCYLGKVYLWAGSPLMKEFEKYNKGQQYNLYYGSKGKTYDYDTKYCKLAAETFGKALEMVARGVVSYKLAEFKYSSLYDHEKDENAETCYSDNFYTVSQSWMMPGTCEAIFRGLSPEGNTSNWNCAKIFGPKVAGIVAHDNIIHHPTANLIDEYGMANGEPIYLVKEGQLVYNDASEWDSVHPYANRDPRFYHDIIFDGFHYVLQTSGLDAEQKKHEYCSLYTDGAMRSIDNGSSTGYFIQKLVPHQCNEGDRYYDWSYNFHCYLPYMRLADIYLMYAEAQAAIAESVSDLKDRPEYCTVLSAVEAINKLRDRVNSDEHPLSHLPDKYYTGANFHTDFIDAVRRERAVELAFEGFRWCDLQRWLLLTEAPYTEKYSHEFERLESDTWFKTHDPALAKVGHFTRKSLISRDLKAKHYWFPLPDKDTYLYKGYDQNPGW